jgi:hypothetical protein
MAQKSKTTTRIIVVVIVAVIAAYFGFFQEYFAYKSAINDRTESACYEYLYDYNGGRYVEEVRFVECEVTRDILKVRAFLMDYPENSEIGVVNEMKNMLWDEEIKKYEELASEGGDQEAITFFRELLHYMRDHNLSHIYVEFDPYTDLKNYEEYSAEVQEYLSFFEELSEEPAILGNIISLTENFSAGDLNYLKTIVDDGIKESFEAVFSDNFIYIEALEGQHDNPEELVIELGYNIVNQTDIDQEYGLTYPIVWNYTVNDIFESYLLGIEVEFDFSFKIPNSEKSYSFEMIGQPGDEVDNIEDIADGYRRMTEMTFANYANNISNRFGIEGKYFQEE